MGTDSAQLPTSILPTLKTWLERTDFHVGVSKNAVFSAIYESSTGEAMKCSADNDGKWPESAPWTAIRGEGRTLASSHGIYLSTTQFENLSCCSLEVSRGLIFTSRAAGLSVVK